MYKTDGDDMAHICESGDIVALRSFINDGGDPHIKDNLGGTPLHNAAICGQNEIVEYLLSIGVHVDIKGGKNATALHCTTWNLHESTVKLLLDAGADINARTDEDETAYDIAEEMFSKLRFDLSRGYGAEHLSEEAERVMALLRS